MRMSFAKRSTHSTGSMDSLERIPKVRMFLVASSPQSLVPLGTSSNGILISTSAVPISTRTFYQPTRSFGANVRRFAFRSVLLSLTVSSRLWRWGYRR